MKHLIHFYDLSIDDIDKIYTLADSLILNPRHDYLKGKTIVMFFPDTSIRTRTTFESGIYQLGAQGILFPSDALNKKEMPEDVIGYLNNWADCVIVRHHDISLIEEIAKCSKIPVINAMTDSNHPCEILADLYALSKIRTDYLTAQYLFVGAKGNIGSTWKEASRCLGFSLTQCCPTGYEMDDVTIEYNLDQAVRNKDIILTDSLSKDQVEYFKSYQITTEIMNRANTKALLNPCPPFCRGAEVTAEVIDSPYFVGYEFKKTLLQVQQALILHCMGFVN